MKSYTFEEIAKQLGTTVDEIYSLAISEGLLNDNGTPTQKGIESGFFVDAEKQIEVSEIKTENNEDIYLFNESGYFAYKDEFIKECKRLISEGFVIHLSTHYQFTNIKDFESFLIENQ